jgi:hypothetical protein
MCGSATAQDWWKHASIIGAGLIAGVADGQREVIVHNKWAYRYRHPQANEKWWNPDSTWKRADKVPQFMVFTQDKYHLNQAIRSTMFATQTGFVAVLQVDDFKSKGRFRIWPLLLHIAEAQASYMIAKGLTHRYYRLP